MKKIEPKIMPGFMELSPKDQIIFKKIKTIIAKNFELFGFNPIDTVILEKQEVLLAKAGGDTEKQIYSLEKGDKKMCLRFDLTVPFARYVASRENELVFPFKRFQIGKVYRGERAQKCRYREFYQCDIDVIAKDKLSLSYDAEIPCIISNIFNELKLDHTVRINNRKILFGFLTSLNLEADLNEVVRILDKLDKLSLDKISEMLEELNISKESIEKIIACANLKGNNFEKLEYLKCLAIENENYKTGVHELEQVINLINDSQGNLNNFEIDLKIARGLDYYTGTVYETFINGYENLGSVSSGGRYDNLASYYTDSVLPGVGMSIGLTRLFALLKENNLLNFEEEALADCLVVAFGNYDNYVTKVASALRKYGIKASAYFGDAKVKTKMNYANKLGVKFVVIIGEDEIKQNKYTLKNMESGEQNLLTVEEIAKVIK